MPLPFPLPSPICWHPGTRPCPCPQDFAAAYATAPPSTDPWCGYFQMEYLDLLLLLYHLMEEPQRKVTLGQLVAAFLTRAEAHATSAAGSAETPCPPFAHILRLVEYMIANVKVRMPARPLLTRLRVAIAAAAQQPVGAAVSSEWLAADEHRLLLKWAKSAPALLTAMEGGDPSQSWVRFFEVITRSDASPPPFDPALFKGDDSACDLQRLCGVLKQVAPASRVRVRLWGRGGSWWGPSSAPTNTATEKRDQDRG